ncbi:Kinase-like protein, partial [Zostera marina]
MSRGVEYRTSTTVQALLVFLAFLFVVSVDGQKPEGFISIDCGQENSYNDTVTGLPYVSDSGFIDTGENHKIPTDMNATNQQGYHLRSFPNGTRNCYRLQVVKDKKYLIRASFLYANYDGLNRLPQFDLYLDINLWKSINFGSGIYLSTEILAYASRNWMFVCVVDTGSGVPFISSLESRQLGGDFLYPLVMPNQTSVLFQRRNIQPIKDEVLRYPIDEYDRRWRPYTSDSMETLSTTKEITICGDGDGCFYTAPLDVFQTCGVPAANGSTINITFQWPLNNKKSRKVYMVIYYAEIQNLASDQSRNFSAFGNLDYWTENQAYPGYLHSGIYRSVNIGTLNDPFVTFILRTANGTTLPPIISGIEVYEVHDLTALISTKDEEVEDMLELKEFYKLTKNWQGDPCAPKDYVWEGVKCSFENLKSSILSLNLSFNGLSGEIAESFKNFKLLESLILSNNKLSGKIPFLEDLQNLQNLDLSNNNLNGNIPNFLTNLPNLKV